MEDHFKTKKDFLIKLLKPYLYIVGLLIFVSLIASLFEAVSVGMLIPLLTSLEQGQDYDKLPEILQIIANIFHNYSIEKQILFSVGTIAFAVLLKNVFWSFSMYLGIWLSSKITSDLRSQGIDLLMGVGIDFYNKTKAGDLEERVLDNSERIEDLIIPGTEFIVNLASFIVLFALLIIFSWQLTLIAMLCSVLIAAVVTGYINFLSKTGKESADLSRDLGSLLYESISGIHVIKSFVKERVQSSMLKEKVEKYRKTYLHINFGHHLIYSVTESLGVIAMLIIFLVAMSIYNMNSKLLIIQLVPFVYILTRIIPAVRTLNQTRGIIASTMPFMTLTYDLLRRDDKPFIKDGTKLYKELKKDIRFNSVTFSYIQNDSQALMNASFFIPKGKTTAIVGESGAGKSTIVNLLLRFYDPQEGVILLDDEPLEHFNIVSYRQKIGVVSQDTFIFNDTVKNNISFGAVEKPADESVIESAKKAGAHEFIMELPDGYQTILGDRGVRLSGGQRQRIAIARAILKDPQILILDEATSSLDSRTERLIQNAISDLSRNRTVVIVAHRLSTIRDADQIVVFKEGKIVEVGDETQLINNQGEYYKLANAHK